MRTLPGCDIIEVNILVDHIHMLIVIPPKYTVSAVIGQMKQFTTSRLREKFERLEKVYWKEWVVWSTLLLFHGDILPWQLVGMLSLC
jgi:putative transposase